MNQIHSDNCIRTFTGKFLDVFNPDPEMICIEDIAHALSQMPRFGGHLPVLYTVAHHSVFCCETIHNRDYALEALLHDASEAYLMDMPRPIKQRMPEYKKVEYNLMCVIADKFKLKHPFPNEVKEVDEYALFREYHGFMLGEKEHLVSVLPEIKERFLIFYHILKRV